MHDTLVQPIVGFGIVHRGALNIRKTRGRARRACRALLTPSSTEAALRPTMLVRDATVLARKLILGTEDGTSALRIHKYELLNRAGSYNLPISTAPRIFSEALTYLSKSVKPFKLRTQKAHHCKRPNTLIKSAVTPIAVTSAPAPAP